MATTYEAIATTTLGSAAADITFSSIAASWTDLRLVFIGVGASAGDIPAIRFNGATTNYSRTFLTGNGSTASSNRSNNTNRIACGDAGDSTTIPTFSTVDIFSYAGSTFKTVLVQSSEDKNGSGNTTATVGLWRDTAAITSIKIYNPSYNLGAGFSATLYGILAA
jgi:hypothetical protein